MLQFFRRRPSTVAERPPRAAAIDASPLLAAYIAALVSPTDSDDAIRVAADAMRTDDQSGIEEIVSLLEREGSGPFYQLLAFALGEFNDPRAVETLQAIASRPFKQAEGESSRSALEATTLQMTAVESLEKVARRGSTEAVDALVAVASGNHSLAATGTALTALRGLEGSRDRFEEALTGVPGELRYLGALRRIDVREAAQIADPRRHFANATFTSPRSPATLSSDRQDEQPATGAPRVR